MTKVRSEYIKKLMTESNSLEEKLKEVAESTIDSIMDKKTKENLRKALMESKDENAYEEEEVNDDAELETPETSEEEGVVNDDAESDDWDEMEKYKDEDGEYDLRGMDKDELVKVLKAMSPDDAVRIVKNEDDTLTVTDEESGEEHELDIEDETNDDASADEFGGDDEIEIDVNSDETDDDDEDVDIDLEDDDDDIEIELDESSLGYTDNYQKQTAMTTPDNHEPADSKSTYSMDGGVPTGTEKPWVGGKETTPYDKEVNEEAEAECGINEEDEEQLQEGGEFGKAAARSTGKQRRNNSSGQGGQPYGSRHNSVAGEYKDYEPSVTESIKKKANEIYRENKQLKALMGKLQQQVNEAIVVNQSLANVIKLINENSTTVNEKKEILRRFNQCTTREESNKLYSTISEELKRGTQTHSSVADTINSQLSESRERAVETPMYQSQDLSDTLSFMKRLNAIK